MPFLQSRGLSLGLCATLSAMVTCAMPDAAFGQTGTQDFYASPGPVENYANGQVIRTLDVQTGSLSPAISGNLAKAVRIMYRSQAASGTAIAVTGMVLVPKGSPPTKGWPIVVWAHGAVGVNPACAPSKTANLFFDDYATLAGRLLSRGYLVVAIDYQGLAIAGELHPYVELRSEANTVVDGARAARALHVATSNKWVVVGHSQGGQAALGAGEIAPRRAPELDLLGVVSIAPGTSLMQAIARINQGSEYYDLIGFIATSIKLSEPRFDYSELLGPGLLGQIERIQTTCSPISFDRMANAINPRYARSPAVQAFATRNQPGQRSTKAPILLVAGGKDNLVPVDPVSRLTHNLRAVGDNLSYQIFPDADHNTVVDAAYPAIENWIAARFAKP